MRGRRTPAFSNHNTDCWRTVSSDGWQSSRRRNVKQSSSRETKRSKWEFCLVWTRRSEVRSIKSTLQNLFCFLAGQEKLLDVSVFVILWNPFIRILKSNSLNTKKAWQEPPQVQVKHCETLCDHRRSWGGTFIFILVAYSFPKQCVFHAVIS